MRRSHVPAAVFSLVLAVIAGFAPAHAQPQAARGPEPAVRALVLRAGKTKTGSLRVVPVGQRLAAVLEVLRTAPEGEPLPPDAFVFGDEVGGPIASITTTWRSACEKAGVAGLPFHDLGREFACRLLESRAELHDVRDFLGHTNLTTTSRDLRSTAMRLERALRLLQESQAASERTPPMVREGDSRSSATPVPHGAIGAYDVDDTRRGNR